MKKKTLYKILLVLGILTFVIPLIFGIFSSINGYSGLCFWVCTKNYGFDAFSSSIFVYSYIFWPTYVIGIILITLSLLKIRRK